MKQLIIATRNPGKVKEIRDILAHLPLDIISLNDVEDVPEIVEDGTTFAENARKKAETVQRHTDGIVLADDSGLEVDYLQGAPGIYSARYAGENAYDALNNEKLLRELEGVPENQRTARFHCAMAVAASGRETVVAEGSCPGIIAEEPRGQGGFGYDPLFIVSAYDKTFAELPLEIKNEISHRSKALTRAVMAIEKLIR